MTGEPWHINYKQDGKEVTLESHSTKEIAEYWCRIVNDHEEICGRPTKFYVVNAPKAWLR